MYNILICDDEKDIVSALSIYLSTENYKIFTAFTGKEALDVVAHNDIHLVLMDVMMPQMDGHFRHSETAGAVQHPHHSADSEK